MNTKSLPKEQVPVAITTFVVGVAVSIRIFCLGDDLDGFDWLLGVLGLFVYCGIFTAIAILLQKIAEILELVFLTGCAILACFNPGLKICLFLGYPALFVICLALWPILRIFFCAITGVAIYNKIK